MFIGMPIGQLGKATGTAVETIRYYEKIGLLPKVARTSGNYRSYGDEDVDRLTFIRRSRDLGFAIEQVRALLSLADDSEQACGDVDRLAKAHLAEVERKIADLSALKAELSATIERCRNGTISQCQILKALATPKDRGPL